MQSNGDSLSDAVRRVAAEDGLSIVNEDRSIDSNVFRLRWFLAATDSDQPAYMVTASGLVNDSSTGLSVHGRDGVSAKRLLEQIMDAIDGRSRVDGLPSAS